MKYASVIYLPIILSLLSFYIAAQNIEGVNARLDAMAGSAACDDIGWTIQHPASICNFPNQIQGSVHLMNTPGVGKTFGAIIGIVRLNDFLYAGITCNNREIMAYNFFEEGSLFLNCIHLDEMAIHKRYPQLPQVNLCLKINDKLQFGAGGFFEGGSYDRKITGKIPYDTGGSVPNTMFYSAAEGKKLIRNNGFNVEMRIKLDGWTVYPQLMIGFPKIKGSEFYDTLDGAKKYFALDNAAAIDTFTNLKRTYSSPEGLFLRGGSYLFGDIGNTFWKTGVIYTKRRYQFNKKTGILTQELNVDGSVASTVFDTTYDSLPSDHQYNWIEAFLGFAPSFSDNLYFSPEYNGGIGWYKGKDPDTPPDTTFYFMYHNFRLGVEAFINNIWWFDKIGFRCGIQAQWNKRWRYIKDFDAALSQDDESIPWKSFFWGADFTKKEAKVTGGFGVTRGRGTFDISCDFLNWQEQGVLSGPSAAMATITVDFSRKR